MMIQQQPNINHTYYQKPFYILLSKPTCAYNNDKQIFIPLANLHLSIMNIQTNQFSQFGHTLHEKRINCIKQKNNIIITGSNDYTIKLWDRLKPGAQFNCLDLSEHILSAAHTSKLTFWDLRKMKQRGQFNESFNGQITSIQFDNNIPTILMGCSVDGMINKFDLKQPNQQQAFIWCNKILQSPSRLQFINNYSLVSTTNHTLYLLEDQTVKNKIIVNDYDDPQHVLNHKLVYENNQCIVQYFRWNLQKQIVEKFINQQIVGHIKNVYDTEIFIPVNQNNVIYLGQNGDVFVKNIQKGKYKQYHHYTPSDFNLNHNNSPITQQKWQKIQQQLPINKNGFILSKNQTNKNKNKKFKPY